VAAPARPSDRDSMKVKTLGLASFFRLIYGYFVKTSSLDMKPKLV
jgi:hypothetical protein